MTDKDDKTMEERAFLKALGDRFEAWELAELLQLDSETFIEAFTDDILSNKEELEEFLYYGTRD